MLIIPKVVPHLPRSSLIFHPSNGKPAVKLYWMDGGIRPERPEELGADEAMGDDGGGAIITGTKGK